MMRSTPSKSSVASPNTCTRKPRRGIFPYSKPFTTIVIACLAILINCCCRGTLPITFVTGADAVSATTATKIAKAGTAVSGTDDDDDDDREEESEKPSLSLNVIDLNSRNFDSMVADGNVWLIEFYTPWYVWFSGCKNDVFCPRHRYAAFWFVFWSLRPVVAQFPFAFPLFLPMLSISVESSRCRHCQDFATSYANIAASFHSSPNEGIRVGKINCSVERALTARFGIEGFPSFFLIDGWSVYPFDDPRSVPNLMNFARGGYKKEMVGKSAMPKHSFRSRFSRMISKTLTPSLLFWGYGVWLDFVDCAYLIISIYVVLPVLSVYLPNYAIDFLHSYTPPDATSHFHSCCRLWVRLVCFRPP